MSRPAWSPSAAFLAQETHFAFGLGITFGARALGFPAWWGALAILAVDLVKENTFDVLVEGEPFFWDGLVDWGFYFVGVVVAAGLLILRFGWPGFAH